MRRPASTTKSPSLSIRPGRDEEEAVLVRVAAEHHVDLRPTPDRIASSGSCGSVSGSMTGPNGIIVMPISPHFAGRLRDLLGQRVLRGVQPVDRHRSDALPRRRGTPSRLASAWATFAAALRPMTRWPMPLWRPGSRNRPWASGIPSSVVAAIAPADCPNSVTLAGSPPNAAMFSSTQASAARISSSPRFAGASSRSRKPSTPESIVERHAYRAVPGKPGAVVERMAPVPFRYAPPWIHTRTGSPIASGSGVHTLRFRQSSPGDDRFLEDRGERWSVRSLRHRGPKALPSRTRVQFAGGLGSRSRCLPKGGAAYGIPLNEATPPRERPRTRPSAVSTIGSVTRTSPGLWPSACASQPAWPRAWPA